MNSGDGSSRILALARPAARRYPEFSQDSPEAGVRGEWACGFQLRVFQPDNDNAVYLLDVGASSGNALGVYPTGWCGLWRSSASRLPFNVSRAFVSARRLENATEYSPPSNS